MDREELFDLIDEKINDIFLEYQKANDIASGDISPLQSLDLEEIEDKLTDLIMSVDKQNNFIVDKDEYEK